MDKSELKRRLESNRGYKDRVKNGLLKSQGISTERSYEEYDRLADRAIEDAYALGMPFSEEQRKERERDIFYNQLNSRQGKPVQFYGEPTAPEVGTAQEYYNRAKDLMRQYEAETDIDKKDAIGREYSAAVETAKNIESRTPQKGNYLGLAGRGVAQGAFKGVTAPIVGTEAAVTDLLGNGTATRGIQQIDSYVKEHPGVNILRPDITKALANETGLTEQMVRDYAMSSSTLIPDNYGSNLNPKARAKVAQYAENIGQMIPGMALSTVFPSAGSSGFIGNLANKMPVKEALKSAVKINAASGAIGASAAGGKYIQMAQEREYSPANVLNAAMTGYAEALTENMFGFSDAVSFQKIFDTPTGSAWKSFTKSLGKYFESCFEEGLEEVVNVPLEGLADKLTIEKDKPLVGEGGIFDAKEMLRNGIDGAVVAGIMGGVSALANVSENLSSAKDIRQAAEVLNAVAEDLPDYAKPQAIDPLSATPEIIEKYETDIARGLELVKETEQLQAQEATVEGRIAQAQDEASVLGTEGAESFNELYQEKMARKESPADAAETYTEAYNTALDGGTTEVSERKKSIKRRLIQTAERAAQKDIAKSESAVYYGEDAKLVRDDMFRKAHVKSHDALVLDAIANVTGTQVRFAEQVNNGESNASYKDGVITIALDSENPVRTALTHEVVHRIREVDPAAYGNLAAFVVKANPVARKRLQALYGSQYETTNANEYNEEIVADAFGILTGDTKALDAFVQDNRTTAEKVLDWLRDLIYKIEDFVKGKAEVDPDLRAAFDDLTKDVKGMESALQAALEKTGETVKSRPVSKKAIVNEVPQTVVEEAREFSDGSTKFSVRMKKPPKKTGIAYKVFFAKNGKLYPPMVANPGGEGTPVGVWLDADVGKAAPPSKTGRPQVKAGGKGTQGSSGSLSFRPGWHLGDIPYATQFARTNPKTGKKDLFPSDFIWAECEYAKDVDYQEEAMSYGYTENGKFRHAYAGLPKVPTDGYYRYRTNPRPDTVPWIITGAMKVNKILTDAEVAKICKDHGVEAMKIQGGSTDFKGTGITPGETIEDKPKNLKSQESEAKNSRKFDSKGNELTEAQEEFFKDSKIRDDNGNLRVVYHGTASNFSIFDISKAGTNWGGDSRLGPGFYFAKSEDEALKWTEGTKVIKAFLNIKNPFYADKTPDKVVKEAINKNLDSKIKNFDPEDAWISKEQFTENANRIRDIYLKDPSLFVDGFKYDENGKMTDGIRQFLSSLGYDGIVSNDEIVAFYPEQIKSVDNKNPTSDPDIRFSKKLTAEDRAKLKSLAESGQKTAKEAAKDLSDILNTGYKPTTATKLPPKPKQKKGNETSKFAGSVQKTDIFDDKFKKLAEKDANIQSYDRIANDQTMESANASLNEGGADGVVQWFSKPASDFTAEDVAKGFIMMSRYQDAGDYESMIGAAEKLREAGTKGGQMVQMFSILSRMTPEGMVYYAQKTLDKALKELTKNKTQAFVDKYKEKLSLTADDAKFIETRVEQARKLPDGRDKAILLGEVSALIQSKIPSTAGEKVSALARISMLLNPRTNVRNILGNAIVAPQHIASDFIGTIIDKAVAKKTGQRTTAVFDPKSVKEMKRGVYESYDDFRRKIHTQEIANDRFEINGKGSPFSKNNPLGRSLNALDRVTSFLLKAGDRPFFEMWFTNSINGQMRANKVTKPTAEMIDIATQDALQRTWQDDNGFTRFASNLRRSLNFGKRFGLGSLIVPFVKTPSNLAKAIADFSPVGVVKAIAVDARKLSAAISKGEQTAMLQKTFVNSLSKGIAGTLMMMIYGLLVDAGILTGAGDDDKDVADFMRNTMGIRPYSVKIGDRSFTYDWAQPVGGNMAIVADYKAGKDSGEKLTGTTKAAVNSILNALSAGGNILYQQSFMRGVSELFKRDGLTQALIEYATGAPSMFTPAFMGQIAQLFDGTARTSFSYKDPIGTGLNKVKAKIPLVSKSLAPVVDTLGNEVTRSRNPLNVFLNPANTAQAHPSKASDEIYRVYRETGNKAVFPVKAPYYITYQDKRYDMNPHERAEYQKVSGSTVREEVSALSDSRAYRNLQEEQKAKIIEDLNAYGTAKAKDAVVPDYELNDKAAKIKKAEDAGIRPYEYLLFKMTADKDGNEYISKVEAKATLDKMNLSRKEKSKMYELQNSTWKDNPYK